jgi:sugar phosphate isomerase/epimerase
MNNTITRRTALTAGAAAAAGAVATGCSHPEEHVHVHADDAPDFLTPWSPNPNEPRDLTPGPTAVRLCSWRNDCTLDYPKDDTSITEVVERLKAKGFSAGNAYSGIGRKNPWLTASEAEVRELKDACTANDVIFFDMHTVPYLIHPDPTEKERQIAYVVEQCEAAERVGCHSITTHVGTKSTVSPVAPHPDNWKIETWQESVASLKEVIRRTEGLKVNLIIEAVNMTAMNNPRAHKRIMDDVGSDRIKVLLDPINMISLRNYFRTTELINECFDLLGENILACHAKDTHVIPNQMSMYVTEVAAGKGQLDYELYLARLSRMEWPRPLLIEHLPYDEYDVAQKHIEETAARIGVKFHGRA